ncbi:PLP-dependent cysteine synthase family protein [Streptomyces rapamycinicus]|uniref:Cysteine synthase n=2 Tax=Streptomyces rapamycinicus TaxID=1226757 RepID=A0A0A0N5G3_STRRN|nr:pyridoxal-phosphate dependent enzyme [Streptomyces rapamycinicus]AGP51539.1 cysteine synthase [Streptomyces rapamycinicus NRRL 5491]MBB4779656.1 cystathionine beta-synthase [Streptomyces rapamycinicus]RLV75684.1 cysteine synthase [Streptomyces rapamycinicus NRRL 5491]UTP28402.1 pyridoxal-phosphate dependent enzyme [Streptomyces rapamycinicus NRRL 5491]
MTLHESLLDAVGDTPLVRLTRIASGVPAPVYAKVEFFNPAGSVKDRAALGMVLAAEKSGALAPGGVIVEGTSGNTGMALAMIAAQRGYRSIVVVPDRTSPEKIKTLKAYGAEVVVTTGALPREHPEHVRNVAARLAARTPGAWYANQYDNPANPEAHRTTTGPEIWAATGGRITHFVVGVGTGGTVTGTGGFLKEASGGQVRVIGADPLTSTYSGGDGSPYYVESIGHYLHPQTAEDEYPESYDQSVVDRFERIGDRESITMVRRLAREEGILAGGSAGTAVAAALRVAATLTPDDLVVVLLPDSGRGYLSKYFDDDWLRRFGFLEDLPGTPTVADALGDRPAPLTALPSTATVADALTAAGALVPVRLPRSGDNATTDVSEVIGAVRPDALRALVARDPSASAAPLHDHLLPSPPAVGIGEPVDEAAARLATGTGTAWVLIDGRVSGTVTHDALRRTTGHVPPARAAGPASRAT